MRLDKYEIMAAVAASALMFYPLMATPAEAQAVSSPPSATDESSGGVSDDNMAAATGNLQGSVTGEGNLNGPFRNGNPDSPYPTNKEQANMRGVGSLYDPNAPTPAYVGQAAAQ
jgi:hypothetical protein